MIAPLIILVTWIGWVIALTGVGTGVATILRLRGPLRSTLLGGLWLGFPALLFLVALANLAIPMSSVAARALAVTFLFVGWILLLRLLYHERRTLKGSMRRIVSVRRLPTLLYLGLVGLAILIVANFAASEPMDYDTGLYRLGLINYARDFSVIPGLANLHDRFGFNSALYPLAPFMELGVWHGQGFRLVAGLLVAGLATDLLLRVVVPRKRGATPGDWFIVIATAFLMALILTDSGRWIPSPAQDIAAYVPAVASTALLADALRYRITHRRRVILLNLALVTAAMSGSIRPLGWLLTAITAALSVVILGRTGASRTRGLLRGTQDLLPGLAVSAALALVMLARDALLTGWLLFPAKVLPLDVPWRVPDPSGTAAGITSWGRAPGRPADEVLADGSWLEPWLNGFIRSREMYLIGLILLGTLVVVALARGKWRDWPGLWRPILLTLIPSLVYVAVWFATAPDVRFGWAGLIAVGGMPLAWLLARGGLPPLAVRIVGLTVLTLMLGTQITNDRVFPRGAERIPTNIGSGAIDITIGLAPPQNVQTESGNLADGTPVIFPADGENCWNAFPLCLTSPNGSHAERLGEGVQEGFRPAAS